MEIVLLVKYLFSLHSIWLLMCAILQKYIFCANQQTCTFVTKNWSPNNHNGGSVKEKDYYCCEIKNAEILNDFENMSTITTSNTKSNLDVKLVLYEKKNEIRVIPKDLFATFPNTEYFCVSATQNFSQLKPHNLKGATRLITFEIYSGNKLKNLEAKVFSEAPNLIYIILKSNLITDIHKLAFYGLFNLQEIYLQGNQIMTIHSKTFSSLESLNVLDLSDNVCVKKRYNGANGKLSEIENDIKSSCDFDFNYQELREIIDSVENLSKKLISTELKLTTTEQKLITNEQKLSSKMDGNATKASTYSNYLLFGMVAITAVLTLLGIFLIAFVLKSIQLLKSINSSSYD